MEIKRLITHFTYRIEPRPEGGFIAHATDPTLPPLEAATREELQQKIQANISAALAKEFPGLVPATEGKELKFAFHIEQKPGGGFTIHSGDPAAPPIEGATHAELESAFAGKLVGFLGKHLMPELSQALAAQGTGDVKVYTNRKLGVTVTTLRQVNDVKMFDANPDGSVNVRFADTAGTVSNAPITPESSGNWKIFRVLAGLVILAALSYFLFLYHR